MRILIIEDQSKILNLLQEGLEEEGHAVTAAEDGEEGLLLALSENFDLILLDWMLPVRSGLEVCRAIRSADRKTPIIFLTARDTVEDTVRGLEAGANDYIKKPFSFAELLARINVYARAMDADEYRLGNLVLKRQTHQVFAGATEIFLTAKEFLLLEFLLRNKGRVCTRMEIIEAIWGSHYDYDNNIIDVFMNGIRKKAGLRVSDELLKTIRGVGFIAND
jgi:DNA-binding response OmpR family regulator